MKKSKKTDDGPKKRFALERPQHMEYNTYISPLKPADNDMVPPVAPLPERPVASNQTVNPKLSNLKFPIADAGDQNHHSAYPKTPPIKLPPLNKPQKELFERPIGKIRRPVKPRPGPLRPSYFHSTNDIGKPRPKSAWRRLFSFIFGFFSLLAFYILSEAPVGHYLKLPPSWLDEFYAPARLITRQIPWLGKYRQIWQKETLPPHLNPTRHQVRLKYIKNFITNQLANATREIGYIKGTPLLGSVVMHRRAWQFVEQNQELLTELAKIADTSEVVELCSQTELIILDLAAIDGPETIDSTGEKRARAVVVRRLYQQFSDCELNGLKWTPLLLNQCLWRINVSGKCGRQKFHRLFYVKNGRILWEQEPVGLKK